MEKGIEEKRERDVCGPMYEGPRKEEKKTGEKRRLQKEIWKMDDCMRSK